VFWRGILVAAATMRAQEKQGPQTAPPPEHDVKRVTADQPPPEAPPNVPQAVIVKHFAEKEEEYAKARGRYGYKKTIRLTEYGADGNPMGEFSVTSTPIVASDGKLYERVTANEPSTLKTVKLSPEDVNALSKIPSYPLAQSQIEKYTITYAGKQLVDEVDCYIYQVKPRFLERANALFGRRGVGGHEISGNCEELWKIRDGSRRFPFAGVAVFEFRDVPGKCGRKILVPELRAVG